VRIKRILAPTDFSPASLAAVSDAAELARRFRAEVILLHVVAPPYAGPEPDPYVVSPSFRLLYAEHRRAAGDRMTELHRDVSRRHRKCRVVTGEGSPAAEILATARKLKVNLIVMATHGRSGTKRVFLGSVAEKVVRAAPCPVLTLRAR
jgi:nucleotide-binding universal stress UspA family protein